MLLEQRAWSQSLSVLSMWHRNVSSSTNYSIVELNWIKSTQAIYVQMSSLWDDYQYCCDESLFPLLLVLFYVTCVYIIPLTNSTSRQNLFHPLVLRFCWRENIRGNKKDILFLLVWGKDSYTERFLALLPFTCELQPTLVHFCQTSSYFLVPFP
jgi:hypothetical protein